MDSESELFSEIESYISAMERLLSEGREEELAALEPLAIRLAEASAALSPEARARGMERMNGLSGRLAALEEALWARKDGIMQEMGGLSTARRAGALYRMVQASDAPPANNDPENDGGVP